MDRPYLVDGYPDILRALAEAAEAELADLAGSEAPVLAMRVSEMVRHQVGGARFRLPVWQPRVGEPGDLFGEGEVPRPAQPPAVSFRRGNNVDLVGFARDCTAWCIAEAFPGWSGRQVADLARHIADRFHRDVGGRDQTYLCRGVAFDSAAQKRRIWEEYRGGNYNELALRHKLSEMRIRQIINEMRAAAVARHQSRLFD